MLSAIMVIVRLFYYYADCHYAECLSTIYPVKAGAYLSGLVSHALPEKLDSGVSEFKWQTVLLIAIQKGFIVETP